MEHCFTLALMLLLVGPLQARPTTTTTTATTTAAPACIELEDLDFDYMDEVKCAGYFMIKKEYNWCASSQSDNL